MAIGEIAAFALFSEGLEAENFMIPCLRYREFDDFSSRTKMITSLLW